jgi:hypothetical protein
MEQQQSHHRLLLQSQQPDNNITRGEKKLEFCFRLVE